MLPALKSLIIVGVGDEIKGEEEVTIFPSSSILCDACLAAHRSITVCAVRMYYHQFISSSVLSSVPGAHNPNVSASARTKGAPNGV